MATTTITESQITLQHLYHEDDERALLSILAANPSFIDELNDHVLIAYWTHPERRELFQAFTQGDDARFEALAMSYVMPDYDATLQDARALADELRDAFELRAGGAMATCLVDDGAIVDVLPDWAAASEPTPRNNPIVGLTIDPRELWARKVNGGELAGDFFGDDAIMMATPSYFDGEYPGEPETEKTCGVKWIQDCYEGVQPGQGEFEYRRAHMPVLHGYITRKGMYVAPCPHCQHEATIKICKHLERASEHYISVNLPMRYLETTEAEAKRLRLRINQRNKRSDDGIIYNKARIPQENDRAIFIHDADDIEGTPLPVSRAALYALVMSWVVNRPKGKRGSHGLVTWGNQTVKDNTPKQSGGKKKRKLLFRIFGDDNVSYRRALEAFLDEEIHGRRYEFTLQIDTYIRFLNETGLDYAIADGDKNVIDKLLETKDIYLTDDKAGILPDSGGGAPPKPVQKCLFREGIAA
jgi:hypothetical protein